MDGKITFFLSTGLTHVETSTCKCEDFIIVQSRKWSNFILMYPLQSLTHCDSVFCIQRPCFCGDVFIHKQLILTCSTSTTNKIYSHIQSMNRLKKMIQNFSNNSPSHNTTSMAVDFKHEHRAEHIQKLLQLVFFNTQVKEKRKSFQKSKCFKHLKHFFFCRLYANMQERG